jgi:hypothetical protein
VVLFDVSSKALAQTANDGRLKLDTNVLALTVPKVTVGLDLQEALPITGQHTLNISFQLQHNKVHRVNFLKGVHVDEIAF